MIDGDGAAKSDHVALTAEIVSAYVSNNTVPATDIPALIAQVHGALSRVSNGVADGIVDAPKPRAIAILKSGVVDGMSYTLYVDGSIEAELPQGTLRFASIHELRAHLEQNG